MNIRCPDCHTLFRLDVQRIPQAGANARCSRCGTVFPLGKPPAAREPREQASEPAAPTPPPGQAVPNRPAPERNTAAVPAGVPDAHASEGGEAPMSADHHARARRYARALVSDIVAYHPDLVSEAADPEAIQETFREEIMKSWQEYVEQVGRETAEGTPFFREALNDLLAEGRKVF